MTCSRACFILALLWAAIYLPGLGSQEIRGEEWRRVLPARTMLNTGEWVVPQIGGKPYLRKPPLINWISAASFKLTGIQNEWTARLPSVLTVLLSALGMVVMLRKLMGIQAALLGGVFYLAMAGVIEKGRLAELEVYYIAFTGLAFAAWLAGFTGTMNRWLSWSLAGLFLGLGMLIKGPIHLLFFYTIVLGACWSMKRWRNLFSLSHLWALVLCMGVFAAWAVPFAYSYAQMLGISPGDVVDSWNKQITSRTSGEDAAPMGDRLTRIPEALALFLPWVLVVPLWWKRRHRESALPAEADRRLFAGLAWGAFAGFAIMLLLPSASPRYIAPLFAPVAMMAGWFLHGWALKQQDSLLPRRWAVTLCVLLTLVCLTAFVAACGLFKEHPWSAVLIIFCSGVLSGMTWFKLPGERSFSRLSVWTGLAMAMGFLMIQSIDLHRPEVVRPLGRAIAAEVQPHDAPLYLFRLGPLPYPFYLPTDYREISDRSDLPEQGLRWMLTDRQAFEHYKERLERDYGPASIKKSFTATWGDRQRGEEMLLIRFNSGL